MSDTPEIIIISSDEESKPLVTSPKLSLKRNQSIVSPDRLQVNTAECSMKNGLKRRKLDQLTMTNVELVPFLLTREEKNRIKFSKLLEYSKSLMDADSETEKNRDSEAVKEKIVKNMWKKLSETQSWYAGSEIFSTQIDCTWNRLKKMKENSGDDVFSILQEMRKEFKNFKNKSKVGINKEISQDCNSGCSSSVPNDKFEMNVSVLNKETKINFNFENSIKEMSSNSHTLSGPEPVIAKGIEFSGVKVDTVKQKASPKTLSHTVFIPETAKNSDFVNNAVVKGSSLCSVLSHDVECTSLKSDISYHNSLAKPSTSGLNSSTSNISVHPVISKKYDKPKCTDLSSFNLQPLESRGHLIKDDNICISLPSSSKADPDDCILFSNVKSNTSGISDIEILDIPPNKKYPGEELSKKGNINTNISIGIPANKINHVKSVLKMENSAKEVNHAASSSKDVDKKNSAGEAINEPVNDRPTSSTRHIQKLEKMLKKLDKKIKKLQEAELSGDDFDDENSAYIMEGKYKERFNKIYAVLCKLKKQSSRTGRIIEKKFKYEGSRYKQINVAVEKMINKRKASEKFPNYIEMLSLLKHVNDIENIGLSEGSVESEAEKVFKDVGRALQIRRCRDLEDLFGCHLTDNFDPLNDPAEQDDSLKNILNTNKKKFEETINEVIDSFAEKEKVTKEEDIENKNSSEDEDDQDEKDNDLPVTDPASPNTSETSDHRNRLSDDDVIEIVNESDDKSTDPNEETLKKKEDRPKSNSTVFNCR